MPAEMEAQSVAFTEGDLVTRIRSILQKIAVNAGKAETMRSMSDETVALPEKVGLLRALVPVTLMEMSNV